MSLKCTRRIVDCPIESRPNWPDPGLAIISRRAPNRRIEPGCNCLIAEQAIVEPTPNNDKPMWMDRFMQRVSEIAPGLNPADVWRDAEAIFEVAADMPPGEAADIWMLVPLPEGESFEDIGIVADA
jgi:hypothetical protein